jgi:hypothetical protein
MPIDAIKLGRGALKRGHDASDELADSLREIGESVDDLLNDADRALARFAGGRKSRKAPLVLTGAAAALGGYLLGRKTAAGNGYEAPNPASAGAAVAASRPQPPKTSKSS